MSESETSHQLETPWRYSVQRGHASGMRLKVFQVLGVVGTGMWFFVS